MMPGDPPLLIMPESPDVQMPDFPDEIVWPEDLPWPDEFDIDIVIPPVGLDFDFDINFDIDWGGFA